MLKFNTATPAGLSSLIQAVKIICTQRNSDIRQLKTGKLLNVVGEAQGVNNWQTVSALMETPNVLASDAESKDEISQAADQKQHALEEDLTELLALDPDDNEALEDKIYGSGRYSLDVTFALSSSTNIIFTVDSYQDVTGAKIVKGGFERAERILTLDEIERLTPVFQDRIQDVVNDVFEGQ